MIGPKNPGRSRPHIAAGAYDPERVQVCAQGLLLREHGFECDEGVIYFAASKERVRVTFDEALVDQTLSAIYALRGLGAGSQIPPPLEDSPKCPRCSLVGICLPDEVRFLNTPAAEPRPLFPSVQDATPLYVQSPRAYVRKDGERFVIEVEKVLAAEARIGEVSQVAVFGHTSLTAGALHECFRRGIPVTWHTYGGWFVGHTVGTGHHNVETRTDQYRASFEPRICLGLARGWVAAKIANCRTLLRRNWRGSTEGWEGDDEPFDQSSRAVPPEEAPQELMLSLKHDGGRALRALSLEELLGFEGAAASRYFQSFSAMLRQGVDAEMTFDFMGRNRRPPKDPVNALLSFAYSMLTREWTIALSAVGLDPYRGFYHQPRFARPALSLDMMEPFRPLVADSAVLTSLPIVATLDLVPFRPLVADSAVLTAINNGEVRPTDFVRAAGGCNMSDSGRKRFIAVFERRMEQEVTHPIFKYRLSYRRLFEVQARLLIRHLGGEIPEYPNFVTR